MSTAKKFLTGAIGFVVAILFCLTVVSVSNKGQNSVNSVITQYDAISEEYADVRLASYDNGVASGSEIMKLIKDLDASSHYSITVINGKNNSGTNATGTKYEFGGTDFDTKVSKMEDKSQEDYYINPMASFTSVITEDSNGVIIDVTFTQRGV